MQIHCPTPRHSPVYIAQHIEIWEQSLTPSFPLPPSSEHKTIHLNGLLTELGSLNLHDHSLPSQQNEYKDPVMQAQKQKLPVQPKHQYPYPLPLPLGVSTPRTTTQPYKVDKSKEISTQLYRYKRYDSPPPILPLIPSFSQVDISICSSDDMLPTYTSKTTTTTAPQPKPTMDTTTSFLLKMGATDYYTPQKTRAPYSDAKHIPPSTSTSLRRDRRTMGDTSMGRALAVPPTHGRDRKWWGDDVELRVW
ncbi:hypothetical protein BC832DRAFT_590365 [Gaertneriomyces semiglobifer]|nr:hypothetical protein BC832DRAFT_590365 [Gaertneriomyces semiglobifer]